MEREEAMPAAVTMEALIAKKKKPTKIALPHNTLRETFLKKIYYLDNDYSKWLAVGLFQKLDKNIGVLIKTGKSYLFWSYNNFNQLSVYFNGITEALNGSPGTISVRTPGGYEIKVRKVFGKQFVSLRDNERTILLSTDEWSQFLRNLSQVKKHLAELFVLETDIQTFIERVLKAENEDDAVPPDGLPAYIVNQLIDEVLLYKKWLQWH